MKRIIQSSLFSVLFLLAGCAGTRMHAQGPYTADPTASISYQVEASGQMPEKALGIFKDRLNAKLGASGQLADGQHPARTIDIVITHYYMRPGAARALVGAMAGSDNMQSTVTIHDGKKDTVLGTFTVESKNPSALFTSRGLIEDHADQIVRYVTTGTQ
ncbi:DUF4410 domain-containing protein [Gallaecimonas kandeliae]|uniref:DUF4410 domain-containing protein n=1 Tax=Gallaecimonas kandeliae TaxID=3029055 RepID=UPI0026497161|nr:DUF4410 domain-containing protein [Gallaecimonas kandeliae]WKE67108.1 DUF4410 domain-containing protein [Gallaecimonas kandeliae]